MRIWSFWKGEEGEDEEDWDGEPGEEADGEGGDDIEAGLRSWL